MAVVPKPVSVAAATELMMATPTSLEIHLRLGELVMSWERGVVPLNVPMAMYCEVSPVLYTTCEVGMMDIAVSPFALELETVTVAVPTIAPVAGDCSTAVMVAVPGLTA